MARTELDALRSVQRWAAGFLPAPWDVRLQVEPGREPRRPYALIEQVGSAQTDGAPRALEVTVGIGLSLYLPVADSRAEAAEAALEVRELVWQAAKVGGDPARPTTDRLPLWSYEPRPAVQRVRVRDATAGSFTLTHDGAETDPIAFDATSGTVQTALNAVLPEGAAVVVMSRGRGVYDVHFGGSLLGAAVELLEIDTATLTGPGTVREILSGAPAPWRSDRDWMRVTGFDQTTVPDPDDPKLVMVAVDLRCAFTRGLPVAWDRMLLNEVTADVRLLGGC